MPSTPLQPRPGIAAGRLLVLAVLVLAGLWFWSAPWLAPLRLLVVLVHETGHALATLLFGGKVERILVGADESGQCLSSLPTGWLPQIAVYSAGYVGSAISGALQLVLAFRFRLHRGVLYAMGVWVTAMGVIYAGNAFTLAYCLGMGAVLLVLARVLPGERGPGAGDRDRRLHRALRPLRPARRPVGPRRGRAERCRPARGTDPCPRGHLGASLVGRVGGGAGSRWLGVAPPRCGEARAGVGQVRGRIRYATNEAESLSWK